MAGKTVSFEVHGPLLDKNAATTLIEATNRGLLDLVTIEGAARILGNERKPYQLWGPPVSQYRKSKPSDRHGRKTGELRRHVGAAVVRDGIALIAAGEQQPGRQNLRYANWVEGIDDRNRPRPGFPGYFMFKDAEDHISNNPKMYEEYIGAAVAEAFS